MIFCASGDCMIFKTYAEAASYAKRRAQESALVVRMGRLKDDWAVYHPNSNWESDRDYGYCPQAPYETPRGQPGSVPMNLRVGCSIPGDRDVDAFRFMLVRTDTLLTAAYGQATRLSDVLSDLGASLTEIRRIRDTHAEDVCRKVSSSVGGCFATFRNGERDYLVLKRRLGLDGDVSSLQQVADDLGISRERVRQIENRARRKCKSSKVQAAIREALKALLAEACNGSPVQ